MTLEIKFMKTIIAPTDFSPISLNAVNYAADMAVSINADLSLLYVCLLPITYGEAPYPIENMMPTFCAMLTAVSG